MYKKLSTFTCTCFLILTFCVFYASFPNPVLGQEVSLAKRVATKYRVLLQREDIQAVLPEVLVELKSPNIQNILRRNPAIIDAVVANPDLLVLFVPDIDPKFITLLKEDQALRRMLSDPLVQALLADVAAIDELAGLLNVGAPAPNPEPGLPDLPAQQIYNEAIHSVVWIATLGNNWFGKGSGVVIDKARRLVVTNEHVVRNTELISAFFPFRRNGRWVGDEGFYFENWEWLDQLGFHAKGRVVARSVRNDLAIVQLDQLPATSREIQHDFSKNLEDSMRRGDTVHILGNPGKQLWHWMPGKFVGDGRNCLPSRGDCLVMEAGTRRGNSGGPVLNGRGMLIGILAAGNDETLATAVPAKNVKALLATLRPRWTFRIGNRTRVPVRYQIKWTHNHNWKQQSVRSGYIKTHSRTVGNIPRGYPQIRFNPIARDWRVYTLRTSVQLGENNDGAPTYFFQYNRNGERLGLYRGTPAAPALSEAVPEENILLANYPNPFNPETWIPYQLAKPAEVKLSIYSAKGELVRTLALGHQPVGIYQSKSRAAYWDGRNAQGEKVASGIYFYTLSAGDFSATRKLLIRK